MPMYQHHIFSPYRVCPLGAHVDHQHGLVSGFAIDKGVDLWFDVTKATGAIMSAEPNTRLANASNSRMVSPERLLARCL